MKDTATRSRGGDTPLNKSQVEAIRIAKSGAHNFVLIKGKLMRQSRQLTDP